MKDLPPPLPPDDIAVHLPGGDVVIACEAHAQEALVILEIEISLAAVIEDVGLTMLEGVHGTGVDVQVRINLYGGDAKLAALVQWRPPCRGTFLNTLGRPLCYCGLVHIGLFDINLLVITTYNCQ